MSEKSATFLLSKEYLHEILLLPTDVEILDCERDGAWPNYVRVTVRGDNLPVDATADGESLPTVLPEYRRNNVPDVEFTGWKPE